MARGRGLPPFHADLAYGPASPPVTGYFNAAYLPPTLPVLLAACLPFGACTALLAPGGRLGALWLDLLRLYRPERHTGDFIALRRRRDPGPLVLATVEVRPTLLGRLVAALFSPPRLRGTVGPPAPDGLRIGPGRPRARFHPPSPGGSRGVPWRSPRRLRPSRKVDRFR